jgi:hypothetical protein
MEEQLKKMKLELDNLLLNQKEKLEEEMVTDSYKYGEIINIENRISVFESLFKQAVYT